MPALSARPQRTRWAGAGVSWVTAPRIWAAAAGLALLAALLVPSGAPLSVRAAAAWDAATLALLGLSWWVILRSDAEGTRRRAVAASFGRGSLLVIAAGTSAVALATAIFIFRLPPGTRPLEDEVRVGLGVWALAGSWAFLHTAYALHYARLYYRQLPAPGAPGAPGPGAGPDGVPGGLDFPGGPPAEMDFAYFAFTLGMTFQTSDVAIVSAEMRRVALGHAVIAFAFNTVILALAVSVLGNVI